MPFGTPFKPGHAKVGGRKPGTPDKNTPELREIARAATPEAFERVLTLMRTSKDEHVVLRAIHTIFDRGWGKPEFVADLNLNHNYVVAPEVMSEKDWIAAYASGVAKTAGAFDAAHRPEG
jgi:hypothetical protein